MTKRERLRMTAEDLKALCAQPNDWERGFRRRVLEATDFIVGVLSDDTLRFEDEQR